MGFDAVGSEVLAGLLEKLPKRIVIADIRELKKFSPRVLVGALGVFRQPTKSVGFKAKHLGAGAIAIVASDGVNGTSLLGNVVVFLRGCDRSRFRNPHFGFRSS
jgi:hypothetical protein